MGYKRNPHDSDHRICLPRWFQMFELFGRIWRRYWRLVQNWTRFCSWRRSDWVKFEYQNYNIYKIKFLQAILRREIKSVLRRWKLVRQGVHSLPDKCESRNLQRTRNLRRRRRSKRKRRVQMQCRLQRKELRQMCEWIFSWTRSHDDGKAAVHEVQA